MAKLVLYKRSWWKLLVRALPSQKLSSDDGENPIIFYHGEK